MKTFYVRVTNVTNTQQIGLVGNSEDSGHFLDRIKSIFSPDDFNFDDLHVLAPLEVYAVHPSCRGILDEHSKSVMVDCDSPLLLLPNFK